MKCVACPLILMKIFFVTQLFSSVHPKEEKTNRTRYRFREIDGTEHYVMLTPEQERFMRWSHDNAIDYDNIDIDVIEDVDWETP